MARTRRFLALSLALPALAMAACTPENGSAAQPAAPQEDSAPASGFEISPSFDAGGYFLPNGGLTAGGWSVDHIFMGHSMEFEAWRNAGSAAEEIPVWLSLNPVGGETATNELGQTYYLGARRIRPDSLTVTDGAFEFRASDEELGDILISGMINPEYLNTPGEIPHSDAAALAGGVEMGGERIRNASFMHWLGD